MVKIVKNCEKFRKVELWVTFCIFDNVPLGIFDKEKIVRIDTYVLRKSECAIRITKKIILKNSLPLGNC